MRIYLDFEKPVADLEGKVQELRALKENDEAVEIDDEVSRLQQKAEDALVEIYQKLNPWQKTQVARHAQRPHFSDYVDALFEEFVPLAGDRKYAEDAAIQAGFARFQGQPVALIGHEKGSTTETRLKYNFGMARPEGYRKAVRIMEIAERFSVPIISLVDTAGAYPGIGAEERGQAEAIARSIDMSLSLTVPNLAIIIGEGGSGGAIAIATANRVVMLEHSIYTVASPEASASILWRDSGKARDAANSMKITSSDLLEFGVIDAIIPELAGGAHRNLEGVFAGTSDLISTFLNDFKDMEPLEIRENRREKFMAMGSKLN